MGAVKDLFASERGLFAIVLVIAATVLAALSLMTVSEWREFSLYVFAIFASGKTLTTAVGLIATKGVITAPPVDEIEPIAAVTPPPTPAKVSIPPKAPA